MQSVLYNRVVFLAFALHTKKIDINMLYKLSRPRDCLRWSLPVTDSRIIPLRCITLERGVWWQLKHAAGQKRFDMLSDWYGAKRRRISETLEKSLNNLILYNVFLVPGTNKICKISSRNICWATCWAVKLLRRNEPINQLQKNIDTCTPATWKVLATSC